VALSMLCGSHFSFAKGRGLRRTRDSIDDPAIDCPRRSNAAGSHGRKRSQVRCSRRHLRLGPDAQICGPQLSFRRIARAYDSSASAPHRYHVSCFAPCRMSAAQYLRARLHYSPGKCGSTVCVGQTRSRPPIPARTVISSARDNITTQPERNCASARKTSAPQSET